jgi:hypothetical protein
VLIQNTEIREMVLDCGSLVVDAQTSKKRLQFLEKLPGKVKSSQRQHKAAEQQNLLSPL